MESISNTTWADDFIRGLANEERVRNERGLISRLSRIASRAYFTTLEDADYQEDDLRLSEELDNYCRTEKGKGIIKICLDHMFVMARGNWLIKRYVEEYAQRSGILLESQEEEQRMPAYCTAA